MTDSSLGGEDEAGADVPFLAAIKRNQKEVDKPMSTGSPPEMTSPLNMSIKEKIEKDTRSVCVVNVDYEGTVEELKQHFNGCGSINKVTILNNKFDGRPKGCAYIEFGDKDSVQTAIMAMDESLFRGRRIKVMPKRTNKPGLSTTNMPPAPAPRWPHNLVLPFGGGFSPYYSDYSFMRRGSKGKRRSIPDSILGAPPPRLKPNLNILHAKKEIYRALNINPNTLPRKTVTSARLKRNLDTVHAKKEIYRALNINPNSLPRETVKSAPKNVQTPEVPKPTVHKSTNTGKLSENKVNSKRSDGNCSRSQNRKRTAMYSSQHWDSETSMDDCAGKHSSDSGRQTSSSNSSWKLLQLEQLKEEVKQLILDHPDGVRCMELSKLYREQYHRELNFLRFGYTSIVSFAGSLGPHVLVSESGDCMLHDARRTPYLHSRELVRRLPASRLKPAGVPVDPNDELPGIDFTSSLCYLYPRFHALKTGATPNYAEIHAYLRDGIALDYVDDYRRHVPVEAYRPPPTPASDPSPSPSPPSTSPPPLPPHLKLVNRVPLFPSRAVSSPDSGSECAASDIVTEEPCCSSLPPLPPTPPRPAAVPCPPPAPPRSPSPQMMMPNFMAQPYPSLQSLYFPMYPPYGPQPPQFYQMPPMQLQPVPPMQYPTPTPVPRPPYQSPTKPVEPPASERKTPPQPTSPPPPYDIVSGGASAGGGEADAEGRGGGGETRRVSTVLEDVTLTASECEIFTLLSRVDPNMAHWYMVDAIGRRMTTSNTTVTSRDASTLNLPTAEFQQVAATQTEACTGADSLQSTVKLFMESLPPMPRPPPGFD